MEVFQFKKFSVQNERSSMKVNTDGVLLGAAMTLRPSDRNLLDIGTGTGVIALMAAQRLAEVRSKAEAEVDGGAEGDFKIIGIDIDHDSAMEAKENFASSPWSDKLAAKHISLSEFEIAATRGFDLIFSNPPYFESSLKSPDERKRAARHAETLSYREIIAFASRHLVSAGHLAGDYDCSDGQHPVAHEAGQCPTALPSEGGRLSLILPYETEREAVRYAASFSLRLFRRLRIHTTPSRPLSRVILEFTLVTTSPETISNERTDKKNPDFRNEYNPAIINDELTIQDPADRTVDNPAGYTPAYRSLVRDFLLI